MLNWNILFRQTKILNIMSKILILVVGAIGSTFTNPCVDAGYKV